jgi:putative transposase
VSPERRTCRVLGQPRATQRYKSLRSKKDRELLAEMRRLARQRPRFGCERIFKLLVSRGWQINEKRVHRLWKQESMRGQGLRAAFRCDAK